ncbi:putative phosphoglycerate mutase family protein [Lactarius hengduanensis]|nr:putative phosphoglycerate mutase family protein [Lactarius hengduanensis]
MGWFGDDHDYAQAYSEPTRFGPSPSAIIDAAKAYEEHCAREGKPDSHAKAKEIFAGFAGVAVDRLVETKGLDFIDREKAKRTARQHGEDVIVQEYQY